MKIASKVLTVVATATALLGGAWLLQAQSVERLNQNRLMLARLQHEWGTWDRAIAETEAALLPAAPSTSPDPGPVEPDRIRRSAAIYAAVGGLRRMDGELRRFEQDFAAHNLEENDADGIRLARVFAAHRARFSEAADRFATRWDGTAVASAAGEGGRIGTGDVEAPLLRSLGELRADLREIVEREVDEIAECRTRTVWVGWGSAMFAALVGGGLFVVLRRDVLRPLAELEHTARRVTQLDERPRVRLDRDDELGTVARAFDEMLVRLDASTVSREELERAVRVRTAELGLLSLVAQHTTNLVVITDAAGAIESVNAGFERVTGYTLAEVRGRRPGSFLQGPATDPETVALIRERVRAGRPVDAEILNYTKAGTPYWLRLEIQPVRDDAGALCHFIAVETEITGQKRAAAELESYRSRLELALDAAATCTFDLDLEHARVSLDSRWSAMLGGPAVEIRQSARRILSRANPEDRRTALERIADCRGGRRLDYRIEYRVRDFCGRWRWIHSSGKVVERDAAGRGRRIIGTNTDITERKLAEMAGVRQLELFRALSQITLDLLEHRNLPELLQALVGHAAGLLEAPIGMLLLKQGDDFHVGARTEGVHPTVVGPVRRGAAPWVWMAHDTRRPAVAAAATPVEGGFLGAEDALGPVAVFPLVLNEECVGVLHLGRRREGSDFREAEVQLGTLFARLAALTVSNARIYADALAAADARTVELRQSEIRFRTLAEVSPVGIFSTDRTGRTNFVNRRWCEIAGLDETQATSDRWIDAVHPDDRDALLGSWAKTVEAGLASSAEFRFLKPDGTVTHLVEHWRPQFDSAAEVVGFVGTITDITNLRQAEDARRQTEAQLRHAQKMESLGTLAGGIAHDFNNILTGIFGFAELARLETGPGHPAEEWIDNLSISANRAKSLVQKILTFARKTDEPATPVRLAPVVEEAIGLLRSSVTSAVELRHEIDATCPPVLADSTQIHQIVMNLCTNSLHALPKENGRIEVRLVPGELRPGPDVSRLGLRPGRHVLLSVQDNGHGMSPAVLERIFEPFFTTKQAGVGTGLGLAMVHGIVRSHGGAVDVESAPGKGTTFTIYLPVHEADAPPAVGNSRRDTPRGRGESILFVDDDDASRASLARLIHVLGYRVTVCDNPRDALDRIADAPAAYDLLVTDLAMPEMSGEQLAARVRALRPDLPIVAVTGFVDPHRLPQLKDCGIAETLLKPPTIDGLGQVLARFATNPRGPASPANA